MDLTRCVEEILGSSGYRERLRGVDRLAEGREDVLAEEFCRRAHAALRTNPGEALQLARLGCRSVRGIEADDIRIACHRAAAQAAVQGGRYAVSLRMLDRAAAVAGDADEMVRADLTSLRIQALSHLERYEEARDAAESALPVFQKEGNLKGVVRTRISLAELEFRLDNPRAALKQYNRLDRMLPEDAPARLRGIIAGNRANSLEAVNRFRAATRQFEMAKDLFAAEGCDHTVAQVEYNAAYADMLRGRFEDALRRYSRVEPEFERLSDERHLAHTELDRAEIHLALNLPDDARKLADLAERRFAKLGLEKERTQAAHLAGRAAEIRGDTVEAERLYRRAEEGFGTLGLNERRVGCIIHRASLALAAGRRDDALDLLLDAENTHEDGMNPLGGTSIALLCARLHLSEGDTDGALDRVR
jgi:tetratricopeptide (TPR) repeat protein